MGSEIKMQIPSDQKKIDTNNLGEFIWWCAHLGTEPEKLLTIIEKNGNAVEKLRPFLPGISCSYNGKTRLKKK
jgi:hypothetical protein